MKPQRIVFIAAALMLAVWWGVMTWADPEVAAYWPLFLVLSPLLYFLLVILIGLPVLALLGVRRRSAVVYVLALLVVGAAIGGVMGAEIGILPAVFGSLFYGTLGLAIVRLCDVEANHTIDTDRSPVDKSPSANGRSS
jgi:hypothetical protein